MESRAKRIGRGRERISAANVALRGVCATSVLLSAMATARKKSEKTKHGKSAGVRELRQSASQLLALVSTGEIIEITDRGNLVARLVPPTKSLYEEYLAARLIKAPRDPHVIKIPTQKYKGDKPLSQVLIDNRTASRF